MADWAPDAPLELKPEDVEGPFTAGQCQVYEEGTANMDGAAIFGGDGQPILLVSNDMCVEQAEGARKRINWLMGLITPTNNGEAVCLVPRDDLFEFVGAVALLAVTDERDQEVVAFLEGFVEACADRFVERWQVPEFEVTMALKLKEVD